VTRNGHQLRHGVRVQRFLCRRQDGTGEHAFQAPVVGAVAVASAAYSPPDSCLRHPGSEVVLAGHGARTRKVKRQGEDDAVVANVVQRQRYLCTPQGGAGAHTFYPPLSRLAVAEGQTCSRCAEPVGANNGDTTAGRGHKHTSRVVAEALAKLAAGESYGGVSVWARGQRKPHSHAPTAVGSQPAALGDLHKAEAKQRQNAWRLAADWTETFTPVLWDPWAAAAREQVLSVLGGPVKDREVVSLLVDDIPIFARGVNGGRALQRFSVLAASESFIDRDADTRVTRLRLLRAYPTHSGAAYRLLLAELGYVPDIILADGGAGIASAARSLGATNPDRPFQTFLSAYHLRVQLRRHFAKLTTKTTFQPGDLLDALADWSFISSAQAWHTWWAKYEQRLRAQGVPYSAWPRRWMDRVKPGVDEMMDVLETNSILPRSTGALEAALFTIVKPTMTARAHGLGNLARTNRLLSLMTLRANGAVLRHRQGDPGAARGRPRVRRVHAAGPDARRAADVTLPAGRERPGAAHRRSRAVIVDRTSTHDAHWRALTARWRVVVVDTETNGLFGNVRILSLAAVELDVGFVVDSRAWLLNPGRVRLSTEATAKNGLTRSRLAGRKPFAEHADEISEYLSAPPGKQLLLIGHKVTFDADNLYNELAALNRPLPQLRLLDTSDLAEATGVIPASRSLAALLDAVGVTNTAAHTALGDALATAAAATLMLDTLGNTAAAAGTLATALEAVIGTYVPTRGRTHTTRVRDDGPQLTPRHSAAHEQDLSDGRRRGASLDVCLAETCTVLADRMEDGIVTHAHARQVIDWAFAHIATGQVSRVMTGRLLRGVGRALRRAENPAYVREQYRTRIGPLVRDLGPCTTAQACGRCEHRAGVCRFTEVLRSCAIAFLHERADPFARPKAAQVAEFLPGYNPALTRGRGRPVEGFYGELRRDGNLDAAGYGAVRVAEFRRASGNRPWAYAVLAKAWADGARTPALAERLPSMTVVDATAARRRGAPAPDAKQPARDAIDIIDACLAAHPGQAGNVFARLDARRTRLQAQVDATPRPPRRFVLNTRAPHAGTLGRPPRQPGDDERPTGGPPKISAPPRQGRAHAKVARSLV